MSWTLEITPDALTDIEEAATSYEMQEDGLGLDFARTVLDAIDRLAPNPLIFRLRNRRRKIRWFVPPRFPYRIFYRVRDERVSIFAVIHAARHDRHWKKRL